MNEESVEIEVQPRIEISNSDTIELESDTSTSSSKVNEESVEILQFASWLSYSVRECLNVWLTTNVLRLLCIT